MCIAGIKRCTTDSAGLTKPLLPSQTTVQESDASAGKKVSATMRRKDSLAFCAASTMRVSQDLSMTAIILRPSDVASPGTT